MNQSLWHSEFNTPMPEGATYDYFNLKRRKKWLSEDIAWQFSFINKLKEHRQDELMQEIVDLEQRALAKLYKEKINLEKYGVEDDS